MLAVKVALYVFLFFMGIVSIVFAFFPHKLVQWHASYSRRHLRSHDSLGKENIDSIPYFDPFKTKPLSQFIEVASENPGKYPRFILGLRVVGCGMFFVWSLIVLGVMCSISQGNGF